MIEIGAGGGSIASIDEVGLLRVGPRSAGSDPGPACYGKGGTEPTVTDANLLLGYYDPEFFLGGQMALDKAAAEEAVSTVAGPLGLAPEEAAWGVHKVVVESMAGAARVHLVEKGKDPRRHAMVGFGGAGPAHAVGVARALGVREVIVPPASGAASAVGFLAAPLSFEQVRSMPVRMVDGFDAAAVNAVLGDLEEQGRAKLAEAGVPDGVVRVERTADMRLIGQLHEISVPLPDGVIDAGSLGRIRDAFADTYKARYTSLYEGAEIEAISFRVTSFGPTPSVSLTSSAAAAESVPSKKGTRNAYFNSGWVEVDVHDRYALVAGDRIDGPAIIEERESTTVIPPGDSVLVDPALNLRIEVAAPEEASAVVTADTRTRKRSR
ncbi:hydantoinase/oxoprolinase family protein [Saccharopolyspora ipomoeae]